MGSIPRNRASIPLFAGSAQKKGRAIKPGQHVIGCGHRDVYS
jgi:hypothetical protein